MPSVLGIVLDPEHRVQLRTKYASQSEESRKHTSIPVVWETHNSCQTFSVDVGRMVEEEGGGLREIDGGVEVQ